jgi:hypothetical protein
MPRAVSQARGALPTTATSRAVAVAHAIRTEIENFPMLQHRLQLHSKQLADLIRITSGHRIPVLLTVEQGLEEQLAYTRTESARSVIHINGREVIARSLKADAQGNVIPDLNGMAKQFRGLGFHEMGHVMFTPRWEDDFPPAMWALQQNMNSLREYLDSIDPYDSTEFVMLYYLLASYMDSSVLSVETRKTLQLQPFMARVSGRIEGILSTWIGERLDFVPPPASSQEVLAFINSFGASDEEKAKIKDLEDKISVLDAERDQKQKDLTDIQKVRREELQKRQDELTKQGISKKLAYRTTTQEVQMKSEVDLLNRRIQTLDSELNQVRVAAGRGGKLVEELLRARSLQEPPPGTSPPTEEELERDLMELMGMMMERVLRFDRSRPERGCRARYFGDSTPEHQTAKRRIEQYFDDVLSHQTLPAGMAPSAVRKNFDTLLERAIGVAESQSQSDTSGNAWVMIVQTESPNGGQVIQQWASNKNLIEDQRLETQLAQLRAGMGPWFEYNVVQVFDPTFRYGLTAGRFYLSPDQLEADRETTRITAENDPTKPPIEGMLEWMGPIAAVYVPLTSPRGDAEPNDVVQMGHLQALSFMVERLFWPTESDMLQELASGLEPGDLVKIDAPVPTGMPNDNERKRMVQSTKERVKTLAKVALKESEDPFEAQRKALAAVLGGMAQWIRRRAAVHEVMNDLGIRSVSLPPPAPAVAAPLQLPAAPKAPPPVAAAAPGSAPSASPAPRPASLAGTQTVMHGAVDVGPKATYVPLPPKGKGAAELTVVAQAVPGKRRVLVGVSPAESLQAAVQVYVSVSVVNSGPLRGVSFPLPSSGSAATQTVDVYDLPDDTKLAVDVWMTSGNKAGPVKHMEVSTFP